MHERSSRFNRAFAVLFSASVFATSACDRPPASASPRPPRPVESGDYWFEPKPWLSRPLNGPPSADDIDRVPGPKAPLIWCVERLEVAPDRMVVHVRRELYYLTFFSESEVEHRFDAANRNVYLVDESGRRYDHRDTGGAARTGGVLRPGVRLHGTLVFPPPRPGARQFVFHDDNHRVRLEGLTLDPRFLVRGTRQEVVRTRLAAADLVRFDDSRGAPPLGKPTVHTYLLRRAKGRWTGKATFGMRGKTRTFALAAKEAALRGFFDALAESPLINVEYQPFRTHLHDNPNLQIEIIGGGKAVLFRSHSQGPARVPWAADLDGRTFTVPSDAPTRALAQLEAAFGLVPREIMLKLWHEPDTAPR